jgi:hypothetical protein
MQPPENQRYSLRLTGHFAFYDTAKTQMWHEFVAGSVITEPAVIELLEAHHAPVEKLFEGEYLR